MSQGLTVSFDCAEPMHVHVRPDRKLCKFWLQPLALADSDGFSAHELSRIRALIADHSEQVKEAWNEHCGDR